MTAAQILIVEDDPSSIDVLSKLLHHHNIPFDIATDATQAIALTSHNTYTLAIIDLALPGMDGWQLMSILRQQPQTQALKMVAFTAYYDSAVAREARRLGFTDCLPKPATLATIKKFQSLLAS